MTNQEIQDWLDLRESPKEIGGLVCYVRSEDVREMLKGMAIVPIESLQRMSEETIYYETVTELRAIIKGANP